MTCQNLIDKYSDRSTFSHRVSTSSSLAASSRHTKSCSNLASLAPASDLDTAAATGMRRSKSYTRITEESSAYEKNLSSYRNTIRNMYTNLKDFSARTVSAISSDRAVKGLRFSSVSQLPRPSNTPSLALSSHSAAANRSLSKLPSELTTDHDMKTFRQAKLSNTFLGSSTSTSSSLSSYIGATYRQYSSAFTNTTSASKNRFSNVRSVFAC